MVSVRLVIGHYVYKWSFKKILKECNWPTIEDMNKISALKNIHKILTTNQPSFTYSQIKHPRQNTAKKKLVPIPTHKSLKTFM